MENTYILNKPAFQRVIENCNNDIERLAKLLCLGSATIEQNYKLAKYYAETAERFKEKGLQDCYLDVNKLLFVLSVTGEKVFDTPEKIILSCMILEFPNVLLWNGKMIREYTKKTANFKDANPTRIASTLKTSDIFEYDNAADKYQLNINSIIKRLNDKLS